MITRENKEREKRLREREREGKIEMMKERDCENDM